MKKENDKTRFYMAAFGIYPFVDRHIMWFRADLMWDRFFQAQDCARLRCFWLLVR